MLQNNQLASLLDELNESFHLLEANVDASAVNLMRPAFYDAYHHITVAGKEKDEATEIYDITGYESFHLLEAKLRNFLI